MDGQLGNGSHSYQLEPVPVTDMSNAVAIASGENHSLAIRADRTVWAWGSNLVGGIGDGTYAEAMLPVQSGTLAEVASISAGDVFSLALTGPGELWGWGGNSVGQLGVDPAAVPNTPFPLHLIPAFPDPVPPDQGNVLLAVRSGQDVHLSFPGAPALRFRLFRDPIKTALGTTPLVPDVAVTSFADPAVVPGPPPLDLYRLKGLSPCSGIPGP